jgi:hypothetical protein
MKDGVPVNGDVEGRLENQLKQWWMEQHDFKNANNTLNTNIYFYLETSGVQSSNLYLNFVHFANTSFD